MYRVFSPVISLGANSSVSSVITAALPPPLPKKRDLFLSVVKLHYPARYIKKIIRNCLLQSSKC